MERPPSPLAAPGKYEARITIDGKTYTQPVAILADPKVSASTADLEASVKLQVRINDDVTKVADMVNRIEWMREQLAVVERMADAHPEDKALHQSVEQMDQKMQDVEYEMLSKPLAASDDKTYISAWKIYYNLLWLSAEIGPGAGDVAGGLDSGPTDTEVELTHDLEQKLAKAEGDYNQLMTKEVPAFNRTLTEHSVTPVVSTGAPASGPPPESDDE
jgi:hypothetical protein